LGRILLKEVFIKVYKLPSSIIAEIKEIEVEEHLSFDRVNKDSDGDIMFSNTHFKTFESAKEKQLRELESGMESAQKMIDNLKKELGTWESKKDLYYIKMMKINGKL
jgi:hypothetical protein